MSDATAIHIRPATLEDAETVARFNEALADETEGKTLDPETIRQGVRTALADPRRARYLVAEIDGEVVGQLMLTFEWSDWRNGDIWWFQSVYVHRDHRRKGVFRALFDRVRDEATANPDVVGLRLYVENENADAQRTYHDLGFHAGGYHVLECFLREGPANP